METKSKSYEDEILLTHMKGHGMSLERFAICGDLEYYEGNCIYCGVRVGQIGKSYSQTYREGRIELLCKKCDPRRFDPRGLK